MEEIRARTGRQRQRYDGKRRLVSGCIPYRMRESSDEHRICLEDMLEVLMLSSPNRDDLVFPKGGWEDDETVYAAARREALEEAGVRGILHEEELGVWEFRSKSNQSTSSAEGGCRGHMFAMKVTEELEAWPEQEIHDRKWLDIKEAFELCRYDWMREALEEFLNLMAKEHAIKMNNATGSTTGISTVKPDCRTNKQVIRCTVSSKFYYLNSLVIGWVNELSTFHGA